MVTYGNWSKPEVHGGLAVTCAEICTCWEGGIFNVGNGFIDVSLLGSVSLLWEHIDVLPALVQSPDASGSVLLRTNNRWCKKLQMAR
jgi:hypothetical protein